MKLESDSYQAIEVEAQGLVLFQAVLQTEFQRCANYKPKIHYLFFSFFCQLNLLALLKHTLGILHILFCTKFLSFFKTFID